MPEFLTQKGENTGLPSLWICQKYTIKHMAAIHKFHNAFSTYFNSCHMFYSGHIVKDDLHITARSHQSEELSQKTQQNSSYSPTDSTPLNK